MTARRSEHYSLEQLVGRLRKDLPARCNVLVRLDEQPHFHDRQGGHWLLKVRGVTSNEEAWIAVHRDPAASGLGLGYRDTLPELLEIFDNPRLRRGLQPGELALVQARPGYGEEGKLYLNYDQGSAAEIEELEGQLERSKQNWPEIRAALVKYDQ